MTLREALLYSKEHGGYVAYNDWIGGDENSPQHYWDRDGVLNWDHWGTVGGLMPDGLDDKRIKGSLNMEGFGVFTVWADKNSKVNL